MAALAVTVTLALRVGKASNTITNALTPKPGRPPGYSGPGYAGMLVQDHVAAAPGAAVDASDETVTAGNLTHTASYFGPTLCSPVTLTNRSNATKDDGAQEWKLQQPNGVVVSFAITGTLSGGGIAPGATARGTVCFGDTGQSGTFVLLWQPLLSVGRAAWLLRP
jgi:hypothetical protein